MYNLLLSIPMVCIAYAPFAARPDSVDAIDDKIDTQRHCRRKGRFMISICPKCRKQVTIPRRLDGDSLVRCPLCEDEYQLSESLDLAPPELIVVSPVASEEEEYDDRDVAVIISDSFPTISASDQLRPRNQKSGARLFIEVIAGGLAGCMVAYYALAFYYGPQFQRVGLPELPLPYISQIISPSADEEPSQPILPNDSPEQDAKP